MMCMSVATSQQAREAVRLAESDPQRAMRLAAGAVKAARLERNPAAAAVAERALGLAAMQLQDIDGAVEHLRRAISLGRRTDSPGVAGAGPDDARGRPEPAGPTPGRAAGA